MNDKSWSAEEIADLERLALDGLSASQIGNKIGRSRNAVVGKVHRLREKDRVSGAPVSRVRLDAPRSGAVVYSAKRQEKHAAIRAALDAGLKTQEEIAAETGASLGVVQKLSRAMGPKRKQSARQISDARTRERIRVHKRRKAAGGDIPPVHGYRAECFRPGYLGQEGRIALADLESHHCRFPIDVPVTCAEKTETRYCGAAKEEGSSYCSHHAARCFSGKVSASPRKGTGMPLRHLPIGGWA